MNQNNENPNNNVTKYYRLVHDDDIKSSSSNSSKNNSNTNKGRHLIATEDISVGQLLFVERPIFAFQSLQNIHYNRYICYGCKAFCCNTIQDTFQWRFRTTTTTTNDKDTATATNDNELNDNDMNNSNDTATVAVTTTNSINNNNNTTATKSYIECRNRCGYIYCNNNTCEVETWKLHHQYLCTGLIPESSSDIITTNPILQYKNFAIHTNEIFICIAEWYFAQHTTTSTSTNTTKLTEYTDYIMNPWWDVVTDSMIQDTTQPIAGYIKNGTQPITIHTQLYTICEQATILLNHIIHEYNTNNTTNNNNSIPPITTYEMSCRIGAMEQNAMGIRQRNILCTPNVLRSIVLSDNNTTTTSNTNNNNNNNNNNNTIISPNEQQQKSIYHDYIVQCLQETGFLPKDDDDDDDECDDVDNQDNNNNIIMKDTTNNDNNTMNSIIKNKRSYTSNDIALCISKLYINEDFSVHDTANTAVPDNNTNNDDSDNNKTNDSSMNNIPSSSSTATPIQLPTNELMYNCITDGGDDLDVLFPPLDGTAMYSIACKMNHSCEPNVILLYRRRLLHNNNNNNSPLTAYIIALRDIQCDEELTISYINANQSYYQRQKDLQHYGFICQCTKCIREKDDLIIDNDDDDDEEEEEEDEENKSNMKQDDIDNNDGEMLLQQKLERLDTIINHSMIGSIPSNVYDPVRNYIIQTINLLINRHQEQQFVFYNGTSTNQDKDTIIIDLLQSCSTGIQNRDYSLCKIIGHDLKDILLKSYYHHVPPKSSSTDNISNHHHYWPTIAHREAYFCCMIVVCVGYCHDYDFIAAKCTIDHLLEQGLPRICMDDFVEYIQYFGQQMLSSGPYTYVPCKNVYVD